MRTLLLVDRDQLLRWSVETHLRLRFKVVSAVSRMEALAALENHPFDALVYSVDPGSSTTELEESARKQNHHIRIVRLTTGERPAVVDPTVVTLEKPFRLEALERILADCGNDRAEEREVC